MSANVARIPLLCLTIAACATLPGPAERPPIVQLAISGSQGPCDWGPRQEPDTQPDHATLGATYWPHHVLHVASAGVKRLQPLRAYGSVSNTEWTRQARSLCLTLHKRPSVFIRGIAPVAMVEIMPDGSDAHVTAQTSDPALTQLRMQLSSPGMTPQTLTFDTRKGRAEARLTPPPPGTRTRFILIAVEQGGAAQAPRALALLDQPVEGVGQITVQGGTLVHRPYGP